MNKKILMFMILGMFLISFTSAVTCNNPGLPNAQKLDVETQLIQVCDSCTYVNISSITSPNSTEYINEVMTKTGTTYNYTYIPNQIGTYFYSVIGNKGGGFLEETLCFEVTPSGSSSTTGESILYLALLIVFFGITITMVYFSVVTPYYNDRNENGGVTRINKLKYLKIIFIAFTYPVIIILLNFLNGVAERFTTLTIFGGIIGFLFETMLSSAWIFTILIMIWIVYLLIRDSNFKKLIKLSNTI